MGLFVDGPPNTIDELAMDDSALLAVALVESIDVNSKIALAWTELSLCLNKIFGWELSIYAPTMGETPLDSAHLCVTPSVKRWHAYKSLELFYRDASFSQLNDRYEAKWQQYLLLSDAARRDFSETGAGLVADPLAKPDSPTIVLSSGVGTAGTAYLAFTFVNAAGQESAPSTTIAQMFPNGSSGNVTTPLAPTNAVSWNLYGGTVPTALTLQNAAPIVIATTWQMQLPLETTGAGVGAGQVPDFIRDLPRRIMRG